jgi:hypothetical protein
MNYQVNKTLDDAIRQAADNLLHDMWFRGMDDEQLTRAALEWVECV